MKRFIIPLFFLLLLSGCAVNPVTGERELSLLSQDQEISIGKEQYNPSIQMQGGPYAVDPELTGYVSEVGGKLAAESDRRLPYEFSVINNSVPNAWALPGGKIAVNRGLLLELENEAELAAVIGHEIVHAAARHGARQVERGLLIQGGVAAAGLAMKGSDYGNLAVGGAQVAAQLINQKYSREAESESDYYGIKYMAGAGYDPQAAVSLQEKFVKLAGDRESGWLEGLFASHPPSRQRVEENKITAQTFQQTNSIKAEERYQRKTASIRDNAPAYAAYNKGRAALEKGDLDKAAELAADAISIEPKEGKFYGLKGDVLAARNNYQQAMQAYNQGIRQPGEFFNLYLRRGLARKKLNQPAEAKEDFQKSLQLLPTSAANNELGNLALAADQNQEAKEYFRQAASSESRAGKEALSSLVRLELRDNPEKHIKMGIEVGDNNIAETILIKNTTPLPVRDIVITAAYTGRDGRRRQKRLEYSSEIGPGQTVRFNSSLPAAGLRLQINEARVN